MISKYLENLSAYLNNPVYSEIVATRFGEIGLEKSDGSGFEFVIAPELDRRFWEVVCIAIANDTGQLFNADNPRVAAKLPGGHRFEAILGSVVESGISVAIRLKRLKNLQLSDFGLSGLDQLRLLKCLKEELPIIISGGTSSGKTTLLNTLIQYIPLDKRIICVEDTAEVELPHPNQVRFVLSNQSSNSVITWSYIIDSILRSRPDIVVAGELSTKNTFEFISLLNTGHGGFITTVHANTPQLAIEEAIPQKIALGGKSSIGVADFIMKTVGCVIQISRCSDGKRRVTDILWNEQVIKEKAYA